MIQLLDVYLRDLDAQFEQIEDIFMEGGFTTNEEKQFYIDELHKISVLLGERP